MIFYDISGLRVLTVDKHAAIRTLLQNILREFGLREISEATSPEQGFETFNATNPDLVLTDWAPNFDGLNLVRKIRNDEASQNPHAPILMITAFNEDNHLDQAMDAGMTGYLSKPLSPKLLYMRIASVIENKRPFIRTNRFLGHDRRRFHKPLQGPDRRTNAQNEKLSYETI